MFKPRWRGRVASDPAIMAMRVAARPEFDRCADSRECAKARYVFKKVAGGALSP